MKDFSVIPICCRLGSQSLILRSVYFCEQRRGQTKISGRVKLKNFQIRGGGQKRIPRHFYCIFQLKFFKRRAIVPSYPSIGHATADEPYNCIHEGAYHILLVSEVVSNRGIQVTLKIVSKKHFSKDPREFLISFHNFRSFRLMLQK